MSSSFSEYSAICFEDLPYSAIEWIFRFLGDKPRHVEWDLTVSAGTALALLQCGDTLRHVSQTVFRTFQYRYVCNEGWRECHCGSPKIAAHLHHWIPTVLGHGLYTFFLRKSLSPTISGVISKNCTGIHRLTFSPLDHIRFPTVSFGKIIASCVSNLEFYVHTTFM